MTRNIRDGKILIRYMYGRDETTDKAKHDTYKVYHHVFDPAARSFSVIGSGATRKRVTK